MIISNSPESHNVEWKSSKLGNELGNTKLKILSSMRNDPKISAKQLSIMLSITTAAIEKNIRQLRENGYIQRIGGTRGHWKILE